MTDEVRSQLVAAGVDVNSVMERFMNNDALLERFMRKFKTDPNYQQLLEAVQAKDNDKAFTAAHTLKGVAGNLSLADLLSQVSTQCELFRGGNFAEGEALMDKVTEAYERVQAALDKIYP